jgi:hypothetical protein
MGKRLKINGLAVVEQYKKVSIHEYRIKTIKYANNLFSNTKKVALHHEPNPTLPDGRTASFPSRF